MIVKINTEDVALAASRAADHWMKEHVAAVTAAKGTGLELVSYQQKVAAAKSNHTHALNLKCAADVTTSNTVTLDTNDIDLLRVFFDD